MDVEAAKIIVEAMTLDIVRKIRGRKGSTNTGYKVGEPVRLFAFQFRDTKCTPPTSNRGI